MSKKVEVSCARCFGALANGLRLSIVSALRDGQKNVSQLAGLLHTEQSAVSHNLKKLVAVGFVQQRKVGAFHYYSLRTETANDLLTAIDLHAAIYAGHSPRSSNDKKYCAMLDSLPVPVFIHVDERVVFANRTAKILYREKKISRLLGMSVAQLLDSRTYRRVKPQIEAMLAGQKYPIMMREHMYLSDGMRVIANIAATPLLFRGKPAVQIIVYPDFGRKKAEAGATKIQPLDALRYE